MREKYRVGVIGRTGRGDYGHGVDTVWKEIDRAVVVAVADEDDAGRAKAKDRTGAASAYADYREMLQKERLDIVSIGPRWVDPHCAMALAAAEHGCHVYMEKPFCRDLTEADAIVNAFEMRHLKLAIAHQARWTPTLDVAQRELKKGLIGRVLEIRARGKEDARRGGGEDLWVLGSHVLDLMRAFGGDPVSCNSVVRQNGHPATKKDIADGNEGIGPLTGDSLHATYQLPTGVTGYFSSQRGAGGTPSRFGLQLFGSEGVLEFGNGHIAECWVLQDPAWSPGRSSKDWVQVTSNGVGQPETLPNSGLHGGNLLAVNDLLDCIDQPRGNVGERHPKCSMYDARWTIEMIAGVFESHRLQQTVPLPLTSRVNPLSLL